MTVVLIFMHNNELLFITFGHIRAFAFQLDTDDVFTCELDLVEDFKKMRRMVPSSRRFNDKEFFNVNEGDF